MNIIKEIVGTLIGAVFTGVFLVVCIYLGMSFTHWMWIEMTPELWILARGLVAVLVGIGLLTSLAFYLDESEEKE